MGPAQALFQLGNNYTRGHVTKVTAKTFFPTARPLRT